METVNFSELKRGAQVNVDGKPFEVCVSRGRKMLEYASIVKVDPPTDRTIRRRYAGKIEKYHYEFIYITDFGKRIKTTGWKWYPSEGYNLPGGGTTANKWDIYERLKTFPVS